LEQIAIEDNKAVTAFVLVSFKAILPKMITTTTATIILLILDSKK